MAETCLWLHQGVYRCLKPLKTVEIEKHIFTDLQIPGIVFFLGKCFNFFAYGV